MINMNKKEAQTIIEESLIGNAYSEISVGDWWALRLSNGLWIVSQEIYSSAEENLNMIINKTMPDVLDGIDPENIVKSIVVHRNMRRVISHASIDEDASLKLHFENNWEIIFPSTIEIVDWQWGLNKTGNIPYHDFIVACFDKGTIDVSNNI